MTQQAPSAAPQTDIAGIARQFLSLQNEAIQPAVQQLEARKEPLKARYDAILQSLKGKEQQEITQTQTALGREYGRRGIPTSSGMFEQNVLEKTQPISQAYAGLQAQTGLESENALTGLAQAIASLQGGASQNAIQNALSQYQFGQTQQTSQQTAAAQSAQAAAEQAFRERAYQEVTLPQSVYERNRPYYSPTTGSGAGADDPLGLF